MDVSLTASLRNLIAQMRSQQTFYRNRAECDDYNYLLPILQPDLCITDSYKGAPNICRAIGITYETYEGYTDISIKSILTQTTEICPFVPHYLLINMYGHIEEWDATITHLQQLVPELEVKDVEGMLIGHPNHRITLLQAGNSFVILTNAVKKDLFPKLNATFYYLREQQGLLIPEAEQYVAYTEIRDLYVDSILTGTNEDRMDALYQALEEARIELRMKKERELEKQNSAKLLNFLQDKTAKNGVNVLQNELTRITNTIDQLLRELRELNNQRKKTQLYLAGIKQMETDDNLVNFTQALQEDYEADSLMEIKISNEYGDSITCKDLSLIDALAESGNPYNIKYLTLQSRGILHYWNEDYAHALLENPRSVVYNYGEEAEELFKAIFIHKTVQLRVVMSYGMRYNRDNTRWDRIRRSADGVVDITNGCPHPHIMGYDCWGDNEANIQQALGRDDLYTAYMICKQVLESIALSDSAVVEKMLYYWTEYRTSSNAKFFLIDGRAYNLRDAYITLCKKLAEEVAKTETETETETEAVEEAPAGVTEEPEIIEE